MNPSYYTMGETTVRCSSEVNGFGLDTSYGMYGYPLSGQRGSCLLLVDSFMHAILINQLLLNTSCFFITGLKFFLIDFSSMSISENS